MPCGCSKKQGANAAAMVAAEHIGDPAEWGPFLWKYLHVLAEQIGRSGNTIVDTDQAQIWRRWSLPCRRSSPVWNARPMPPPISPQTPSRL